MTPAELARRLERSFAVLGAGPRGAVARHQTLRATIDWSFQLLAEPEQALLARLAVFAGGCHPGGGRGGLRRGGHRAGCGVRAAGDLVARSLVVAEEHGPQTRYRLLETIRQYGEERLEAGRQGRAVAGPPRQLLRGSPAAGPRPRPRPPGRGVLGGRGSAPSKTICSRHGHGRSAPATSTPRSRSWPASRRLRSGAHTHCCWPGEAALELPGAGEHPATRSPWRSAHVFASIRADVTGAEELCRRAAEANARQDTPDWRVEETICAARSSIAITDRRVRRRRPPRRTGRRPRPGRWRPRRRLRRAHHRRGRSPARR